MTESASSGGNAGRKQLRHDLRTPINHILGYAELLLEVAEEEGPEDLVPGLGRLRDAGKRLLEVLAEGLGGDGEPLTPEERSLLAGHLADALGPVEAELADLCRRAEGHDECMGDLDRIRTAAGTFRHLVSSRLLNLSPESSKPEAPARPSAASLADASGSDGAVTRWGRILVVDDNEANRDLLCRRLRQEGYAVASAADGREALEKIPTRQYDLVLLDILMPGVDGYEVLERVKGDDRLRDIPVIMVSALDEIGSVVRCIERGAEDYLPKPFDPVLLRARVGACLEKKRLREQELEYLRNVATVERAAAAVEAGTFEPGGLEEVARREDELGRLARVFQSMARQVQAREQQLKAQVRQLQIEIDESRKARQVEEIVSTDFFKDLEEKAQSLRRRAGKGGGEG